MCGIIGLTGSPDAISLLLDGLATLEYRGYDSAGIAVNDREHATIVRHRSAEPGKALSALGAETLNWPAVPGAGIGHTRWATHGAPSHSNAHPHADCSGEVAVVHNGIIENYRELAKRLIANGHTMTSQTDTEVVAHLIEEELATGSSLPESRLAGSRLLGAVRGAVGQLRGDFALAVINANEPETLIVARRTSPLIIGLTPTQSYVASDIAALLASTRELYALDDDQFAEIGPGVMTVFDRDGEVVEPQRIEVTWDASTAQKGGYADFMTKEIYEQPSALYETLLGRFRSNGTTDIEELQITPAQLASYNRVLYLACGSSYHAALSASAATEQFARIAASAEVASEFRYRGAVLDDRTLVVAVSQSGETTDTRHALLEARRHGATTITISNVVDSVMTRDSEGALYTHAGPEIGVASTKCHLAQIALLETFALHLGWARGVVDAATLREAGTSLMKLPETVAETLLHADAYLAVAKNFAKVNDFFFLGRRIGLPIALEGALKLKELAYVRAEAYPAGEMKHGPISLIEPGAVVIVVATRTTLWEKVMANVEEMRARGATVIGVAEIGDTETAALVDAVLEVPPTPEFCSPIVDVVPLQFFAYGIASARGLNVDRPRNLAKVVTVE